MQGIRIETSLSYTYMPRCTCCPDCTTYADRGFFNYSNYSVPKSTASIAQTFRLYSIISTVPEGRSLVPLTCHRRRLNRAVLQMRPENRGPVSLEV